MALALAIVMTILLFLGLGRIGAMATGVGSLIFLPIAALIGSFIAAAILYVVWKLMGSEEPYETSYRCVAYAAAIYPIAGIVGAVPYLGSIIGMAWAMYLMGVASVEVYGRKQQNAYAVFGILGRFSSWRTSMVGARSDRCARSLRGSVRRSASRSRALRT